MIKNKILIEIKSSNLKSGLINLYFVGPPSGRGLQVSLVGQ